MNSSYKHNQLIIIFTESMYKNEKKWKQNEWEKSDNEHLIYNFHIQYD
jgi:hypothetical protein